MRNLILAAAAVALIAGPAFAQTPAAAPAKKAPTYDCTKKGNANKAACKTAAAAPAATPAAPAAKPAAAPAAAPAADAKTKKAPTYDCTKKGNANKAACKTAAAAPAATAAAPAAKPAAAAPAPAAKPAAAPAAAAPAPAGKGNTMKACATQWNGFTQAQKDAYKTKSVGQLSKKGKQLSGYNVFTAECMKK